MRKHDAHFTGLHVAQEARRADMRSGDADYARGEGATRFERASEIINTDSAPAWVDDEIRELQAKAARHAIDPRVAPQVSLLPMRTLAFELPFPPSVNDAWHHICLRGSTRHQDRVHVALTNDHRQFRSQVIGIVKGSMLRSEQRAQPLLGRVELRLVLFFANYRRTDIDNRVKPLQDALTHAGAYRDDSQVDRLVVERIMTTGQERCEVTLTEIAA